MSQNAIKTLFTASSTATGGRNGHSEAADHSVAVNLSVPKEMGGPGKPNTTTPEHVFATGYAACFGGAIDFAGHQMKLDASKATVTCSVSIGPREGGGFGVGVKMHVVDKSLKQADLEKDVHEAHYKICPYSPATRGNIPFELEIEGA